MTFCGYFSSSPVAALAEVVVPDSDITTTGWSYGGGDLYQALAIRTEINFVISTVSTTVCPTRSIEQFEVGLAGPSSVPGGADVQGIRFLFKVRHEAGLTPPTNPSSEWTIRLYEGTVATGTLIQSFSGYNSPATLLQWSSEFSEDMPPASVAAITDHNDLSFDVEVGMCADVGDIEAHMAYVQLEYYALP